MTAYDAPDTAPIWLDLMSSDPATVAPFYCELFGWEVEDPNPDLGNYQNFRRNGVRVAGLMPTMSPEAPADVWTIYLRADDIAARVAAVKEAGGQVFIGPHQVADLGHLAVLADPAGAVIGLWQPGTHRGFLTRGEPGTPYWFDTLSKAYESSKTFYSEAFGWEYDELTGEMNYAQVLIGGEVLAGIMQAESMLPPESPSFWQSYITVDDTAAVLDRAVELGGAVTMSATDTPYGILGSLADPFGANITVAVPPVR
ncbi:hypothetical protein SAMN05445060_3250 [Williamsia sterculiae]|uniref:VOC domain-containing protein n=2 Tax=Williamsia sterculiae TaxID=1344003 RepID=A0A1N7GY33_9NOCA|nr:hypothetical protein SAMN05445060_3250 [Williamsia sterculiae]